MKKRTTDKLGNFIIILSKAVQEFYCSFCLVAIALLFSGTPMTLKEKEQLPLFTR
jgi:hypothetical protein